MKPTSKAPVKKAIPKPVRRFNLVFGALILAYVLIPTFTPNLMAFDTNAPKFLALSLVNLLAFITLLNDKQIRQQPASLGYFFKTWVGLVYFGFIVASLLSFFNAINLSESLLQLTKIFTVFSAVFMLSVILMRDLRFLKWVVIIFAGLLIFDAFSVFYYINQFIKGSITDITEIKSIYSNKNVLASALFVKLPFALWLLMYEKKWLRVMGWLGLMTGITAVFFMATRAFYSGLIALTIVYLGYQLFSYFQKKEGKHLRLAGYFLAALFIAYLGFSGTQQFLYPKNIGGRLTGGVTKQLATINLSDASLNARLLGWKWSLDLLKEKPLLGIGSGNWKVSVLKYENRTKDDFTYMYKAHNDFIETFAETGLLGGLLYLGIFILIGWAFLRQIFKGGSDEDEHFRYMFLAAAGLAFYSVDALFNFPADRPEILVLFSFYLAAGISVIHHQNIRSEAAAPAPEPAKKYSMLFWPASAVAIIAFACMSWLLYLNHESSKTQRIVYQEIKSGKLTTASSKIIAGFPSFPTLTILGESIKVQKARYLLSEQKYEQAIALLRGDRNTPWDGRREYFLAMGFSNLKQTDSALVYSEKLYQMKPKHPKNLLITCQMLEERKENDKVTEYLDNYLAENKNNNQVWVFASSFFLRNGNLDKAWSIVEEAKQYLPADTLVDQQYKFVYQKKFVEPFMQEYTTARQYYDKKDYPSALAHINTLIGNVPDYFEARQLRAFIYYYMNDYSKCIEEISNAMKLSNNTGALFNLRGVCYRAMNDLESSCKDFMKAMQMGNTDGKTNYERFCKTNPPL